MYDANHHKYSADWKPIESAQQGKRVLVVNAGGLVSVASGIHRYGGVMIWLSDEGYQVCNLVHWHPLPDPPRREIIMRERFAIIIRCGDGAEMPHVNYTAELYPSGKWGFCWGELDDSGTKFKRDGFQSKVFLYDNREECLVDMVHSVNNFILFNAGLPEEDGPDDPT